MAIRVSGPSWLRRCVLYRAVSGNTVAHQYTAAHGDVQAQLRINAKAEFTESIDFGTGDFPTIHKSRSTWFASKRPGSSTSTTAGNEVPKEEDAACQRQQGKRKDSTCAAAGTVFSASASVICGGHTSMSRLVRAWYSTHGPHHPSRHP